MGCETGNHTASSTLAAATDNNQERRFVRVALDALDASLTVGQGSVCGLHECNSVTWCAIGRELPPAVVHEWLPLALARTVQRAFVYPLSPTGAHAGRGVPAERLRMELPEPLRSLVVGDIASQFRCFGGGQATAGNPVALAFRDQPPMFAAGVDVGDVVDAVLASLVERGALGILD